MCSGKKNTDSRWLCTPGIVWDFNFILWAYCLQTSLHGSCPVIKGEKWVATKWIRDKSKAV